MKYEIIVNVLQKKKKGFFEKCVVLQKNYLCKICFKNTTHILLRIIIYNL